MIDESGIYPFPDRVLRGEKKKEGYTLDWAKAIYYNYNSEANPIINASSPKRFERLRLYGSGNQDPDKYKDLFAFEKDNATGKRKGYNNLDYSITPFMPYLKDTIIELLSERDNYTNVVFLDTASSDEKLTKKYELQSKAALNDFTETVNQSRGVQTPEEEFLPKNKKELDMFELNGGIRLPLEIALEKGLDYIFNYDLDWNTVFAPELKEDFIDIAVAGVFVNLDPASGKIKVRKINPEKLILDGSKNYNYSDAQFAGEIIEMTILDLYKNYNATTGKTLNETQIKALAEKASGSSDTNYGNFYEKDWYEAPNMGGLQQFAPKRVEVLDFVYLSIDIVESPLPIEEDIVIKQEIVSDSEIKSGKIKWNGKEYVKKKRKQTKETAEIEVWRRGKWVIGTDVTLDYGKVFDQVRDDKGMPIRPFSIIRLRSNSIVERIIPHLDALQLDSLYLQREKANATGFNIALDMSMISSVKMGKTDWSEQKILKAYKLGAPLFYSSKKSGFPTLPNGAAAAPLQQIEGGIGRYFNELNNDIAYHMHQIQMNTGLNDVALAQNPNPEVTATQAQMASSGANNGIMNIYKAYKEIKREVAYIVALHLQDEARLGNDYYKSILGEEHWNALASRDINISAKEIKIIDSPSQKQIEMLYQQMNISLEQGLLETSDIFEIGSMIEEGRPLKVISMIIKHKEDKAKQSQMEQAQAAQQANDAKQTQMQQQKLAFEASKVDAKSNSELKRDANKFGYDRVLQQDKYDLAQRNDISNDREEAKLTGGFTKDNN